ncbi:mitochondrial aspartate-glutamate transporter agc1 [Gonapodya sp. JEL0774]|nr:mitochondrial aspartate-glutamate transporter agc1 [Gonapodya sp. JEL0774]
MHPALPQPHASASASSLAIPARHSATLAESINGPSRVLSAQAGQVWDHVQNAARVVYEAFPRPDAEELKDSMKSFGVGSVAGALGAFSVFPLDVAKTRMQMQRFTTTPGGTLVEAARYESIADCFKQIYRQGGIRALYSGLTPQLLGVAPEQAVKLTVNRRLRAYIHNHLPSSSDHPSHLPPPILPLHLELASGAVAGLAQSVFTQPLEIVKIKLQTHGALLKTSPPYKPVSTYEVVRNIGGFKGLYTGFRACAARDVAFNGLYFPVYFSIKHHIFHEHRPTFDPSNGTTSHYKLPWYELLLSGCLAGIPASWIVTPLDVVKTRLQAADPRHPLPAAAVSSSTQVWGKGLAGEMWRIYCNEGVRALWKGGLMRVARTAPQTGVTLAVWEIVGGWIMGDEVEE